MTTTLLETWVLGGDKKGWLVMLSYCRREELGRSGESETDHWYLVVNIVYFKCLSIL